MTWPEVLFSGSLQPFTLFQSQLSTLSLSVFPLRLPFFLPWLLLNRSAVASAVGQLAVSSSLQLGLSTAQLRPPLLFRCLC